MNKELQKFYDRSIDWLLLIGPRTILATIVLVVGLWFIKLLRRKVRQYIDKKNVSSSLRPFIESLIFTALYVVLVFLFMQILGIQLTMFAAVIAAFAAAAGLALSGTLQNFTSGILILLMKPFITGDNIISQGIEGTVTSIRIFYTVITTYDNRTVIMPNSKLSNEVITNVTKKGIRRLDVELSFPVRVPLEEVRKLITDALGQMPEIVPEPELRIGVSSVNTDSYQLVINIWIKAHGFEDTRFKINERLLGVLAHDLRDIKDEKKT